MKYSETSERIKEVIGGEIFNPWEHRRYLPAQFERSCLVDPDCIMPIPNITKWLNTEMRSLGKLMDSEHPRAREIFADRVKFLPVKELNPDAEYSLSDCGKYLHFYDVIVHMVRWFSQRFRGYFGVRTFFEQLIYNPEKAKHTFIETCTKFGSPAEYVERMVKKIFKKYDKMRENISAEEAIDFVKGNVIPGFVRAGVYYYKKSKGETITVDEVLDMAWDDILAYRKSVAAGLKDNPDGFGTMLRASIDMGFMDAFL